MNQIITDINQLDLNKKYTYAEYLKWRLKIVSNLSRVGYIKCLPRRQAGVLRKTEGIKCLKAFFNLFKIPLKIMIVKFILLLLMSD